MTKHDLKKWRKVVGLTQAQLGSELGLDQSMIAHYESGRNAVKPWLIKSIVLLSKSWKVDPPTVRE